MSKINDNTYVNKIKQEIMSGTFKTKDDLIAFLIKSRPIILNDSFFRQELNNSFIKLNEETLNQMETVLLEFFDKRKNNDITNLNLDGVSSFTVDDKDYIKYKDSDDNIIILDDSMSNKNFVDQFQERQNDLKDMTFDGNKNKEIIMQDMAREKVSSQLTSSMDVNTRDLTLEEKRQFASIMSWPNADDINFLVDLKNNLYINKDTGEVYFVNKNEYGQLEVRKASEVTSETKKDEVSVIDDNSIELDVNTETPDMPDFDAMDDSDLEYIYQNKLDTLTEIQRQKLVEIMEQRKQQRLREKTNNQKTNEKVFVKKLNNALHKPYNGFVSLIFLCSTVAFSGLGILMLMIIKLGQYK